MKVKFKFYLIVLITICISYTNSKAQYAAIPDANFKTFLETSYPGCMSGGMLDTTCAAIVTETTLNVIGKNISDLTGVKYFDGLTDLYCGSNQLTSLPELPGMLIRLRCPANQLTSLPVLPNTIDFLECYDNQLSSLPALPNSLNHLWCSYNQLTSLPPLPASLTWINCEYNQLTSLPSLPSSLFTLVCNNNNLTSLPALPNSLTDLACYENQITVLPALPAFLTDLRCMNNMLTSLPSLPNTLTVLGCNDNTLASLPSFPNTLTTVYCAANQLDSLPFLPNAMIKLSCGNNQLTYLPALPTALNFLDCRNNQLTSLPTLPDSLVELYCDNNQLTSIPSLPDTLESLSCSDNPLDCLPLLPDQLEGIYVTGTKIKCLPNIPSKPLFYSNIGYDICNVYNNNGLCGFDSHSYPLVSGKVFMDDNSNGMQDIGESGFPFAKITIQPSNYFLQTDSNGFYALYVNKNTYTISLDESSYPYYISNPLKQTASFTSNTEIDSLNDFAVTFPGNINDLKITFTPFNVARPGRETAYQIWYQNKGTTILSGNVELIYDNSLSYDSSSRSFDLHNGDTLSWNYSNLKPGDIGMINVYFTTPTNATIGDSIFFKATINPIAVDTTAENNIDSMKVEIRGSYDPNFKEVHPSGNITPQQVKEQIPFTYTVYFQNTGNDTAFVIAIRDTISSKFEKGSIETICASHNYKFRMKDNFAIWTFDNILLPDSTTNEKLSHGFIKYRVIPKKNLALNDKIKNTAYIYFDYNAPVQTNTTVNKVSKESIVTGILNENLNTINFQVYPNPSKGIFSISSTLVGKGTIKVISPDGRLIQSMDGVDLSQTREIDLSQEQKGVYFIQVITSKEVGTRKIVLN
jgi:Leucine-rich repeat (LRR) protein